MLLYHAMRHPELFLILHNIRSAENVGAIFRTADAAGVRKIFLTGYSPLPIDRFGKVQSKIRKTALGAEMHVPWEHVSSVGTLMRRLAKEGTDVVAVEQDPGAKDYKRFVPDGPTALLFGNEVRGISKQLMKRCAVIVEIPMRGKKESLNVSVSAGIVLFRILDR